MVSDQDRRELHAALDATLGARPATILMELLPPAGFADLLTRDEFRAGMAEVRGEIADLRGRVDEIDGRLTGQIQALDSRLTGQIQALDGKLTGRIDGLSERIDAQLGRFIVATIPLMFAFAALVLAAIRLAAP